MKIKSATPVEIYKDSRHAGEDLRVLVVYDTDEGEHREDFSMRSLLPFPPQLARQEVVINGQPETHFLLDDGKTWDPKELDDAYRAYQSATALTADAAEAAQHFETHIAPVEAKRARIAKVFAPVDLKATIADNIARRVQQLEAGYPLSGVDPGTVKSDSGLSQRAEIQSLLGKPLDIAAAAVTDAQAATLSLQEK